MDVRRRARGEGQFGAGNLRNEKKGGAHSDEEYRIYSAPPFKSPPHLQARAGKNYVNRRTCAAPCHRTVEDRVKVKTVYGMVIVCSTSKALERNTIKSALRIARIKV